MTELTAKQQRFVEEYLVDLNATQAAIRAGYSPRTAYRTGADNLKKPQISEAIQKAKDVRSARTGVNSDRVLEELGRIAFANMKDYVKINEGGVPYIDLSEMTDAQASVVAEITVDEYKEGAGDSARDVRKIKFKLHDKLSALDKIARHLGMFIYRSEVKHEIVEMTETERAQRLAAVLSGAPGGKAG